MPVQVSECDQVQLSAVRCNLVQQIEASCTCFRAVYAAPSETCNFCLMSIIIVCRTQPWKTSGRPQEIRLVAGVMDTAGVMDIAGVMDTAGVMDIARVMDTAGVMDIKQRKM